MATPNAAVHHDVRRIKRQIVLHQHINLKLLEIAIGKAAKRTGEYLRIAHFDAKHAQQSAQKGGKSRRRLRLITDRFRWHDEVAQK